MTLRPMCFTAMPFNKKSAPDRSAVTIDFDQVYWAIEAGVEQAGLESIRADFEIQGGFIHRPMFERLIVAEYVVADLTFANANVLYEVGVRHGATDRPTVLICAETQIGGLPFDARPFRVVPYAIGADGTLGDEAKAKLREQVKLQLEQLRSGELPSNNPILQVTNLRPRATEHSKTDVFLERMRTVNDLTRRIRAAVDPVRDQSEDLLAEVADEIFGDNQRAPELPQLHSVLIALLLAYREAKLYRKMVDLRDRFERELANTPVALEQHALGLNRLAEAAAKMARNAKADDVTRKALEDEAEQLRQEALRAVELLPESERSSETWGIIGRIHKGLFDHLDAAGEQLAAKGALGRAIDAYERGFRVDTRDYYPGVNAVTLRVRRHLDKDRLALKKLLPAVQFAVARAPEPDTKDERYWQTATKLELAVVARDFDDAEEQLIALVGCNDSDWKYETTANNLRILTAHQPNENRVEDMISALERKAGVQS